MPIRMSRSLMVLSRSEKGCTTSVPMVCPTLAGRCVKGGDYVEPLRGKARIADDGPTQPASAYQARIPRPLQAQHLSQLSQQVVDRVAPALLPEPTEIAKILADLCGRHLKLGAQLLGTHHLNVAPEQVCQRADVLGRRRTTTSGTSPSVRSDLPAISILWLLPLS